LAGLIVSHNDTDHSGGMASVLAQIPVDWVDSSLANNTPAFVTHEHMQCYAGQSWVWDNVHFDMLHPSPESYENVDIKDNNRSCVLRVTSQFGSLLLTGDIEREAEAELLETASDKLAADVLVVPHHGSRTSSTPEFIAAVQPQVAIFTVGYHNRFGHPKQAVLERYTQARSKIYRSDHDGAVSLDFASNKAIAITRWRYQTRHYWQDAAFFEAGTPD
jgi:competence protein ComEC